MMFRFKPYWNLPTRIGLGVGFAILSIVSVTFGGTLPPADAQASVAQVQALKAEAFGALRLGKWDRLNELMGRAATLSDDPRLRQMSLWVEEFERQRQAFSADRRKQYDKAVADTHALLENDLELFAIDKAKDAYTLAEDKEAFAREPWVMDLMARARELANRYEAEEQWIKALRLYGDLSATEPTHPEWKEHLKVVTRRVRLLAMYSPQEFRKIQDAELAAREKADAVLDPATQPATRPAVEENEGFQTDWRDSLKNIRFEMLDAALEHTRENYWKPVEYDTLATGGFKGIQTLLTTSGLEPAFPELADPAKKQRLLTEVEQSLRAIQDMNARSGPVERGVVLQMLRRLRMVNEQSVRLPEEVLVSEFADGALGELDPFTSMIWPSDLEEFNKSTQGEFSGVGIQIQLDDEGNLKVVSPLEDSPAYKQGIKAGDIITRIDGKNAKGISTNQAVKHITGPVGTKVALTVRSPSGSEKEHIIRRDVIKVASVKGYRHRVGGGWDYLIDSEQGIGYVRLTNFTKGTEEELARAIDELSGQGARAVVLDLRFNPGGLLTAATEVADKFLEGGTIVSTRGEREDAQAQPPMEARPGDEVEMPVVVLVNQYSASASEIVSGALQDQKRALVVGERTFGKGSVQMLFPLSGRTAALKLTTSHYYLPSGRCLHREENSTVWGVDPDVVVEMTPEQMQEAIDARKDFDILRDHEASSDAVATDPRTVTEAGEMPATEPTREDRLLSRDPQLAAALLLLRMELVGGTM